MTKADVSETTTNLDEIAASFTFSLLMPKDECPDDIREWDLEKKWDFIASTVSTWDNTL
jgi:hypothetical protein